MEIIIGLAVTVVLLIIGVVAGGMAERNHFKQLHNRESQLDDVVQTQIKTFLAPAVDPNKPPTLVTAETVVATDYFKRFLASFRSFFGGEIKSFNTLVERARRETTCKILEQAKQHGYNAICNLRLEPADIGGNVAKKGNSMVCVVGIATAYYTTVKKIPVDQYVPTKP